MKKNVFFIILMVFMLSLVSCNRDDVKQNVQKEEPQISKEYESKDSEKQENTQNLTITDRAGNEVVIPENMDKIISGAPSITQNLVDLGLGDKIIGVDAYSVDIEGLNDDLYIYDILNPDTEKLISLMPDIIFAPGMSMVHGVDQYKAFTDVGGSLVYFPTASSLDEIREDILFLGSITNTDKKAEEIVQYMDEEINNIKEIGKTITDKKKVYFEIGVDPSIYTFGKNVFLDEMITIVGGENIFNDHDAWISVSPEAVVSANPDVIITNISYNADPVNDILTRSGWDVITAVKDKNVFYVDNNNSSQPCKNVVLALKDMAKFIYPEVYDK